LDAGEQLPTEFDEEDPSLALCHHCPAGADCRGGEKIKALNTWWRSSNMSIVLTQCFEQAACLGAYNSALNLNMPDGLATVEHNETCAKGYRGRLCHACSAGYGRETFDSCNVCPEQTSNKLLMGFGLLCVIVVLIFFIVFTVRTATDERSNASMMFKTLAAYGQVVGIASLFPYRWPKSVLYLFDVLESLTSVSDRILNTDCAMEDSTRAIPLTYEKAVLYMVGPLCFVAGASVFWVSFHFLMKCLRDKKHNETKRNKKKIRRNFSHSNRHIERPETLDNRVIEESKNEAAPKNSRLSVMEMAKASKKTLGKFNQGFFSMGEVWTWRDTKRYLIVSSLICMVILHPTLTRCVCCRRLAVSSSCRLAVLPSCRLAVLPSCRLAISCNCTNSIFFVFLSFPFLSQSLFLFMCVPIHDEQVVPGNQTTSIIDMSVYLRKDVQLECYTPQHWTFALLVGLPGVIGYVIGTPLLTYYVLYKRRHKLAIAGPAGDECRKTYGFIYRGCEYLHCDYLYLSIHF
jgi:hypothetical protein